MAQQQRFARKPHVKTVIDAEEGLPQVTVRRYRDGQVQFEVVKPGGNASWAMTRCYLERGDTANIKLIPVT